MEDLKEIRHQILCLVVEANHLILGEATSEMGYRQGKLVGPGGRFTPGRDDPMRMVLHYCQTDLKITPNLEKVELIAQKLYQQPHKDHDVLVHVYAIRQYSGMPMDNERLKGIGWFPISQLPYERMFRDDRDWLSSALMDRQEPALFVFSMDKDHRATVGNGYVLTGIRAAFQSAPA